MSPRILAVETTAEACSAALLSQGVVRTRRQLALRQHTRLILPMLDSLLVEAALKPNDLDAIALCRGPGSFTGCRIGASVVQAIAFAGSIPVILLSSLQCLAQGAYVDFQAKQALVAIDAHMNEVYWGRYQIGDTGLMSEVEAERLSHPERLSSTCSSCFVGVGSGWDKYHGILASQFAENQLQQYYPGRYPRAADMMVLALRAYQQGLLVSAEQALPVYLRERVV